MFESIKDAKQAAKVLREYLNTYSVKVPTQSETLHLLAQMHGLKNWQMFKAKIEGAVSQEPAEPAPYEINDQIPRGESGRLATLDGRMITGTLEKVYGNALLSGAHRNPDGTLELDYEGETKIWWDGQLSERDDGGRLIFLDEQCNEVPESEVMLMPEDWYPAEAAQA